MDQLRTEEALKSKVIKNVQFLGSEAFMIFTDDTFCRIVETYSGFDIDGKVFSTTPCKHDSSNCGSLRSDCHGMSKDELVEVGILNK